MGRGAVNKGMNRFNKSVRSIGFCALLLSGCLSAYAENPVRDVSTVASGAGKIISGVFALPFEILRGATQSFPFGILAGAIRGTAKTIGGVLGGTVQAASGAAPYAKYAAFL